MKIPQINIIHNKDSHFFKRFSFKDVKCLIVCRGPVRKEAIEVFHALGCQPSGILLSEKDSIIYRLALSPEIRMLDKRKDIHHISDYIGTGSKEEKLSIIQQIIGICKKHSYTHIFAGYGFMAEDEEFITAIENSGLKFVGPGSSVVSLAGAKDKAKTIARSVDISVTPGIDNISTLTLMTKIGNKKEKLAKLIQETGLHLNFKKHSRNKELIELCELALNESYEKKIDLISIEELQTQTEKEVKKILDEYSGYRIRFKYIGGGGGKGQRIISSPKEVPTAVTEVLTESKVTGKGENKNFLIELNIENIRHNEIQLLGNGKWCVSLGGRDCSLQMHEQKLVEVSLSDHLFELEIKNAVEKSESKLAELLEKDRKVLQQMEEEAVRFGEAVGLNSASTFECIQDPKGHYFMEMNTRIQVEHRVTELIHALKFTDPYNSDDYFILDSLVGAMMFTSCYPDELPKPDLVPRHNSSIEVRLNATNKALKPHAGGIITYWTPPHELEIRDDQGIGILNPDTALFIKYNLAGAYDSNAALSLSWGDSRFDNFLNISEVLRQMRIVGLDVETNLHFQYGLVNWFLGQNVFAKPDTQFVSFYLAALGALQGNLNHFNPETAFNLLHKSYASSNSKAAETLSIKRNLILRCITKLLSDIHYTGGWLGRNYRNTFTIKKKKIGWLKNPVAMFDELYLFLRLEERESLSPQWKIWPEDEKTLVTGRRFYKQLEIKDPQYLDKLDSGKLLNSIPEAEMKQVVASHKGFKIGLEILEAIILIAQESGFFKIQIADDLSVSFPTAFTDKEKNNKYLQNLLPPTEVSSNEIKSWTGGTFYSCETPGSPSFINQGEHFEKGQVLGILEVMKMFNKVHAPFSGIVEEILVDGSLGTVVQKGQVIYRVRPDEEFTEESDADKIKAIKEYTGKVISSILDSA
jgi:acetyl/propionyl-CoA carboxylase alpha subunit